MATMMAMKKRDKENKGFFRDGVDLAVVILTDEDETGDARASHVTALFNKFFGKTKRLQINAVLVQPGDKACYKKQDYAQYGVLVTEAVTATKGKTFSICDDDYSAAMKELGACMHDLVTSFELSHTPRLGTVQVRLSPNVNIPWRVEGNKLIFATPPPAGTIIDVIYLY